MFFVFSFFHFLCKLIISTNPLSVTKKKFEEIFSESSSVIYAKSESLAKRMQILLSNIMHVLSQSLLFTCFSIFIHVYFLFCPILIP